MKLVDASIATGRPAVDDPQAIALVLATFGTADAGAIVSAVEDAIEDVRALAPGLGTLLYAMPRWGALLAAPLPIAVDLKSLRRCLKRACADGEDAAIFAHWAS